MARNRVVIAAGLASALMLLASAVPLVAQDTGSLAAPGAVVSVPLLNVPSEVVTFSGTWGGVVAIEVTADNGTTWSLARAISLSTGGQASQTATNGSFVVPNPGYTAMRLRATSWDSGTATVTATRGFATVVAPQATPTPAASSGLPLPPCNPVRSSNCQAKGF